MLAGTIVPAVFLLPPFAHLHRLAAVVLQYLRTVPWLPAHKQRALLCPMQAAFSVGTHIRLLPCRARCTDRCSMFAHTEGPFSPEKQPERLC